MSKSNWSRYTAVGLASSALLVVVFGFGIYSYWIGNLAGYNEAEAQGYQAEYAEYTDQRVARCFEGVAPPRECVEKAIRDNYEQQRSEADLQAQRDMGNWAFWLLVVSSAGLCVTAIGTAFLAWQVGLTVEAVKETAKASKAMDRQNELTVNMQRPWLNFKVTGIERPSGLAQARKAVRVKLQVTNHSNKPAHAVCAAGIGDSRLIGILVIQAAEVTLSSRVKDKLQSALKSDRGMVVFPQEVRKIDIVCDVLGLDQKEEVAHSSMSSLTIGICYQFDGQIAYTVRTYYVTSLRHLFSNEDGIRLPPAIIDDNVKTEAT